MSNQLDDSRFNAPFSIRINEAELIKTLNTIFDRLRRKLQFTVAPICTVKIFFNGSEINTEMSNHFVDNFTLADHRSEAGHKYNSTI